MTLRTTVWCFDSQTAEKLVASNADCKVRGSLLSIILQNAVWKLRLLSQGKMLVKQRAIKRLQIKAMEQFLIAWKRNRSLEILRKSFIWIKRFKWTHLSCASCTSLWFKVLILSSLSSHCWRSLRISSWFSFFTSWTSFEYFYNKTRKYLSNKTLFKKGTKKVKSSQNQTRQEFHTSPPT